MQSTKRQEMPRNTAQMSEPQRKCLDDCLQCYRSCLETAMYCLSRGGAHANDAHLRLMLDCAEFCQVSANFMTRGSEFHARICGVCAEICLRCADDCAQFAGDGRMQACAEACRRCAESCQMMTTTMSGDYQTK